MSFASTDVEVDRAQPGRIASHGRKPHPASISGSALSAIRATLCPQCQLSIPLGIPQAGDSGTSTMLVEPFHPPDVFSSPGGGHYGKYFYVQILHYNQL